MKILMLVLLVSASANSQESFEISSKAVTGVCDSKARQNLYEKHTRAALAYCGTGSFPILIDVPAIQASGNENCQRIWSDWSSASGKAKYKCGHTTSQCESNCQAYGLEFSYCHSTCGGW